MDYAKIASNIAHARATGQWRSGEELEALNALGADLGPAYEIQKELASGKHKAHSGDVVGWKCGATNAAAQKALGSTGPFLGPLFENYVYPAYPDSGLNLEYKALGAPSFKANSEAEFAFLLKADLPERPGGQPYTEAEVWAAVGEVCPALELVCSRYDLPGSATSTAAKVADGSINAAVVLGPGVEPEAFGDPAKLVDVRATLLVDGKEVSSNTGANVLGSPLASLTWLANDLPKLVGHSLKEGDIVMSGAVCNSTCWGPGSKLSVSFVGLGEGGATIGTEAKIV